MLPYAVSALEWEALRVVCLRVLNRGFELAGYRPRPGVALARLFHGRVYLDASTIQWLAYDALGVAPALTNSMLGGPQPAIAAPAVGRTRKWLHGWRILTYSRRAIPIRLAANTGLPGQARARAWAGKPCPRTPRRWADGCASNSPRCCPPTTCSSCKARPAAPCRNCWNWSRRPALARATR